MALSVLSENYGKGHFTIGEIARMQHVSARYLEGILLRLKKAGVVESARGREGGYYLAKDPDSVNLLYVVLLFEDSVAFVSCLDGGNESRQCEFCIEIDTCPIRGVIRRIHFDTLHILSSSTLSDLRRDGGLPG